MTIQVLRVQLPSAACIITTMTKETEDYSNSTFLILMPSFWVWVLVHTEHWYLRSVFFVCFLPVIFHWVTGGFEYLPRLPLPRALPLILALTLEPYLRELGALFFARKTLCSVCFLQYGQNLFTLLRNFILNSWRIRRVFKKLAEAAAGTCSTALAENLYRLNAASRAGFLVLMGE